MSKSPCGDCHGLRHVGCHANCDKYIQFVSDRRKENNIKFKNKTLEIVIYNIRKKAEWHIKKGI